MERQGDHLYSLKSALRTTISSPATSVTGQRQALADPAKIRPILVTSTSLGGQPRSEGGGASSNRNDQSVAGDAPAFNATLASMFKPISARKYHCHHWVLVSLKRSRTGQQSVPSTPATESPPRSPQTSNASRPFLIATLLHLPTQILYAWPIALQGTSSGRCIVTQPSSPPPSASSYNTDAVLSESIKVLADVIQAWIKTGPMRESLRRKESRREKGTRKIGENQQDAIWLNDGLGLAQVNELDRALALERAWKDEGESVQPATAAAASPSHDGGSPSYSAPESPAGRSPTVSAMRSPATSPALGTRTCFALPPPQPSFMTSTHTKGKDSVSSGYNSGGECSVTTPSSVGSPIRPATPRIEISAPDQTALTLGGAVLALSDKAVPFTHRPNRVAVSGNATDDEMREWMIGASLSDPIRAHSDSLVAASSITSSGHSSPTKRSHATSGQSSPPVAKAQQKSVTFSGHAVIALPSPHASSSAQRYRPPFAPDVILTPGEDDEPEEVIIGDTDGRTLWSGTPVLRDHKVPSIRTSFSAADMPIQHTPSSSSPSSASSPLSPSAHNTAGSSSSPSSQSTSHHQRVHSDGLVAQNSSAYDRSYQNPTQMSHASSGMSRGGSIGRINLTPASSSVTNLSPTFLRHSRGASKLSHEIPRSELSTALVGEANSHDASVVSSKKTSSGKMSPTQSFADLKTALKSGLRGSKKKTSTVA